MKIHRLAIPILAIMTLFGGYHLRHAFTKPTTAVKFTGSGNALVECKVEGLRCKGTANFFTSLFQGVEGISSIETIGSEHKATITYNPVVISKQNIREIIERQIPLRDGSTRQIFRCVEMTER